MITINIKDVINSAIADEDTKGDLVFDEIKKRVKDEEKIVLDFEKIELVNTAFLNNAVGRLFDSKEYNLDKNPVRIDNMNDNMIELLKESIQVAREKYQATFL